MLSSKRATTSTPPSWSVPELKSFDTFFLGLGLPQHEIDKVLIESIRVRGNERTEPRFVSRQWHPESLFEPAGVFLVFKEASSTQYAPNERTIAELMVEETEDRDNVNDDDVIAVYNSVIRFLKFNKSLLIETAEEADLFGDLDEDLFSDLDDDPFSDLDDDPFSDLDDYDDLFEDL